MTENQATQFLEKILSRLEEAKVDIRNWEIDHLCYRTSSEENYKQTKETFENLGDLLIESEVNGRLIASYKLHNPIVFKKWIIDLVEVPAPKPNKETKEGFEHIEVVIDESFDDFMKEYPNLAFNQKGLAKELNPELEIEFEDCAVKFHHKSLEHIINIEKDNRIMSFLEELSPLKKFSPCISGTLPLGIQTETSDLDVLFCYNDLKEFQKEAKSFFGDKKDFKVKQTEHQGLPTVVINFDHEGLPVEFFCQNKSVFKQQANQHFLVEGRILKVLGPIFKDWVTNLKATGVKTEPAFGEILGLKEPYQELLDLNLLSDTELVRKLKA